MTALQQARNEYELSKYLQLFDSQDAQLRTSQAALRGSFGSHIELIIMRLGVYGAFLVLNDAKRLALIASHHRGNIIKTPTNFEFDHGNAHWLCIEGEDQPRWIALLQEIHATFSLGSDTEDDRMFSITDFKRDPRTINLAAAKGPESPSFFAGIPLTTSNGNDIGALCVIDQIQRDPLSIAEGRVLVDTARTCIDLLELSRERSTTLRWTLMQDELDVFLESRSLHAQLLEEPKIPKGLRATTSKDVTNVVQDDEIAFVEPGMSTFGRPFVDAGETPRLVDAEITRDKHVAARDNAKNAASLTTKRGRDNERGASERETAYRKIFRRAAECLHSALKADGVIFVDGLIGFHGGIQPAVEPEQELQREMAGLAVKDRTPSRDKQADPSANNIPRPRSSRKPSAHTRLYTSADYLKGVRVERPAEILGFSGSYEDFDLARASESTLSLPDIDEGFLQRLMNRHSYGALWYTSESGMMQVRSETLVEIDLEEEARKLALSFSSARQLMFIPLTDFTSLKRLGACIAWSNNRMPTFTDAVDLRSVKSFVHVVESELARHDASLVAKQKETFVSSVSHELRTPLHGILGAVQLLNDSELDSTQRSLADMIKTCGSTLHETLASVLSYAKINQFERRQHQYRQHNQADDRRALSAKEGLLLGPDRDYEGLYICTNLALLYEETLSVLEAGKSFYNPHGGEVIVVCNIAYEEYWTYYTEPGAIRRIASNLIGNALKYTNRGSIIITLDTAKMIKDDRIVSNDITNGRTVTFTVKDTGKGMSRDFMENQLFLPFTQENSNSAPGVGLGMSIVKSLISLLGGEIEVQSLESSGTEIQVRVPMRICHPNDEEKGKISVQFERDIQIIRDQKLSAVMYGFPKSIRESLTNYLRDWYDCTLLEPTTDARPDIVLVEEGNTEVLKAVRETSQGYGKNGVLLSIVTVPSMMGQRMQTVDGYPKWERVPRPLGPRSVAQALLTCLEKLRELRMYGKNVSVDETPENGKHSQHQNGPIDLQNFREGLPYEKFVPDSEKAKIALVLQTSSGGQKSGQPPQDRSEPSPEQGQSIAPKQPLSESKDQTAKSQFAAACRILVVDDNSLNLRLLGAFLKKNGNRNVTQAKNGKEAVDAVRCSEEGFEIIFMDLSMPVMNGFEATRQIRKMEADDGSKSNAKSTIIIALTGLASQDDENEAFDAGIDLFLTKPMQFQRLADLLRQYEEGTLQTYEHSR